MKLYFYIFDSYNKKIKTGEAEVIEKPKTYKPVDKFPNGFYGCYVRKEDVGHLTGYSNNTVILTEDKPEVAISLFFQKHKIAASKAVEELDRQNAIIDYLQKWRAEHE